jgi:NADH-quinone oxidoreductase subunit M
MQHLLTIVLFLPLAGALGLMFVPRAPEARFRWIATLVSGLDFILSLVLLSRFDLAENERFQFVTALRWVPEVGIQYKTGVDGIGMVLLVLTTLLSWVAILSSWSAITVRVKEYYVFLLLLETGMLGVFAALDMILFYVFWEAMLVPMYFLIGVWGGPRRLYATIKFILYTLTGSLLMLVGILALHAMLPHTPLAGGTADVGTFDMQLLIQRPGIIGLLPATAQTWIFLSFAFAFAIKVPVWPFHTWLPDAHTEAPTAGSVVLAGVLLKMGTYGFVRFCLPFFPEVAIRLAPWGIALGVIGIIYGALVALAQRDMKRMVAYSSVSHLGFVMLGIFVLTQTGAEGAVLQMLNHGISTGALFLVVGILYERRHTHAIAAFGGLWKVMPVFAAFFMIAMLSSVGLPGLNGFIGEFMILAGSWLSGRHRVTALAAVGVILGAAYMLWMFQRVMQGPVDKPENTGLRDLSKREVLVLAPLAVLMFGIGIFPNAFLRVFDRAVALNVLAPVAAVRQAHRAAPRLPVAARPGARTYALAPQPSEESRR